MKTERLRKGRANGVALAERPTGQRLAGIVEAFVLGPRVAGGVLRELSFKFRQHLSLNLGVLIIHLSSPG